MSLTSAEENVLKRIARDNTPMREVNPRQDTGFQAGTGYGKRIEHELKNAPKMRPQNINADLDVEKKLKAAGLKNKLPGEVYSLGISRVQILELSAAALRKAVEDGFTRAAHEGNLEPKRNILALPAAKQARLVNAVLT